MTTARRQRKMGRAAAVFSVFLAVVSGVVSFTAGPVRAATTERIVADPHTGLAISGFDPVAYFTNAAAVPGRPEFELRLKRLISGLDQAPESVGLPFATR